MDLALERKRLLSMRPECSRPGIFLDRDGVLIEEKHHLCDPGDVQLCAGAQEVLKEAYKRSISAIVVTNQSGITRGYFDWSSYEMVTDRLIDLLGPSAPIAGIYANGHGPNAPSESWRKPSPAMLLEAGRDLNVDLKRSILIGDRLSDLEAGARAGVKTLVHVLTGHGQEERPVIKGWANKELEVKVQDHKPDMWFLDSLVDFPESLLNRTR
jgi:D-glycero-D-manno-heptose 1,7-bisphosphate phosphatase